MNLYAILMPLDGADSARMICSIDSGCDLFLGNIPNRNWKSCPSQIPLHSYYLRFSSYNNQECSHMRVALLLIIII